MENTNYFHTYMNLFEHNIENTIDTLCKKLQDKLKEANADGYVLGMSGGIDCSTVAMLCSRANLKVILISLPCGGSMSPKVLEDCAQLAQKAGYKLTTLNISNEVNSIINTANTMRPDNSGAGYSYNGYDIVTTNVPPRIRMTYLYAIAGAKNYLVLGTTNRSELEVGYFTKWGDGASDFEPLLDLTKSEVRVLAKHLGVPKSIINKKPSADLWAGQTDEDEMGMTYSELDACLLAPNEVSKEVREKVEKMKKKASHKLQTVVK